MIDQKPMKEITLKLRSGEEIAGLQASCGCVYTFLDRRQLTLTNACKEHGQDPVRLT
jgi:hypothetical protein